MKNIFKSTMLLLCAVLMTASCSDDRSENPVINEATSFKLNTPSFASQLVDLKTSTSIGFTWSQPDYGFPAAAEYQMQFSLTDKWTTSTTQAEADATGNTVADYTTIEDVFTLCKGDVSASKIAKGLEQIAKWEDGAVPATQEVYARCACVYANDTITSNVVKITVAPYYVELKDAPLAQWYLIGNCIGDGKWTNTADAVGVSIMPFYAIEGEEYDKATGMGKVSYTGYFPAEGQFKLVKNPGSWDVQIDYSKMGGVEGNSAFGTNNDGNIVVKTAGYYTITVDTKAGTASIAAYTKTPKTYATMFLAGEYNAWDTKTDPMTPIMATSGENHDWVKTISVEKGTGTKFKFTDATTWWGATSFPYGTANTSADNGALKPGSYMVMFNDITGQFYFFDK